MMARLPTLDRHLGSQFLRNAALVSLAVTTVFVALDVVLGFSVLARSSVPTLPKILYFAYRIPALLNFALPVSALVAAMVCTVPMLRRGEFTALGAAGVTLRRSTRAILAGCLLLGVADVLIADLVTPGATASSLALQDQIEGQTREGRVWRSGDATWFAGHAALVGRPKPELRQVVIAAGDRLALAARLVWTDGSWMAPDGVVELDVAGGAQRLYRHPAGAMPRNLSLAVSPGELFRMLLPRQTLSSRELLARGERADVATVWSRWSRLLVPVLAAMAALSVVVRFPNKDRIAVATIQGAGAALIPVAILAVSGTAADTAGGPPGLAVLVGAMLAAAPALWLWLRWRL